MTFWGKETLHDNSILYLFHVLSEFAISKLVKITLLWRVQQAQRFHNKHGTCVERSVEALTWTMWTRDLPTHNLLYGEYANKHSSVPGFWELTYAMNIMDAQHILFPVLHFICTHVYLKTKCSTNIWTPVKDIINKYLHFFLEDSHLYFYVRK